MRKAHKLLTSLLLVSLGLSVVSPIVGAATEDGGSEQSKAIVRFDGSGGDDNTIINPPLIDPQEPVRPEDPNIIPGALGLNVSDLDFGTIGINLNETNYPVKAKKYIPVNPSATPYYAAPMIVVKDARGLKDDGWTLTLSSTGFKKDGGATDLKGATIMFKDQTVYNTSREPGSQLVTDQDLDIWFPKEPLTIDTQANKILEGKGQNASAETYMIFDRTWNNSLKVPNLQNPDATYDEMVLNVPSGIDIRKDDSYTATLEWILVADGV